MQSGGWKQTATRAPCRWRSLVAAALALAALVPAPGAAFAGESDQGEGKQARDPYDYSHLEDSPSRIPDEHIPIQEIPERTPPVEFGDPFLGPSQIGEGWKLPTGAVWNPSVQIFGTYRNAVQFHDTGTGARNGEWAHRLDIFGNLFLTGTERVLVGFRPLDDDGRFTAWNFTPKAARGWDAVGNPRVETLFMEGDIGELFPVFDPDDSGFWDFGFAVGRQPLLIQDGMLIDDNIDAVGIIRNTLRPPGTSNFRITALWGWNEVHRGNNLREADAQLFAVFTETDFPWSTLAADAVFIKSQKGSANPDAFYGGLSATQRIGHLNTTFRVNTSIPTQRETVQISRGTLLFAELAYTFHGSRNFIYANGFWGIGEYTSAARGADRGGPLGRVGILFAAVGLGRYGAALSDNPARAAGGALGVQIFPGSIRRQIIVEVGGRRQTDGNNAGQAAVGIRAQQAIWTRFILRGDAFYTWLEKTTPTAQDEAWGGRVELVLKI